MAAITSDLATNLVTAAVALSALGIVSLAALRGWRDWIQLKREELAICHSVGQDPAVPNAGSRIEIADLKERLRKLEAIAAGDLGRELEPMPDPLKTDATLVRGCSASVWVYPLPQDGDRLHFLADSNAAITKGIVALVLAAVQDKPATEVAAMDIAAALAPFDLTRQLSSNRTQGVPNMIALVQDTARRIAGA